MECKYSLIIPVYQVREYIEQCLDSIFCQIPQDVQVILVDDGSTDGSGEICDEYAKRYPQIEVIHQENKGVAAARNAGLSAAKGEYLLWVDPDDWVAEDWFSQIDRVVCEFFPDLICFDSFRVKGNRKKRERYGRSAGFIDKQVFLEDIARDIRMLSGFPNKVVKRSLFDGVWFDAELQILEDYWAIVPIMKRANSFYYIPKFLYYYRQNANSLLHSYSPERRFLCVRIAEKRRKAFSREFQKAAMIGIAIQAFLYCRSAGYDSRFSQDSEQYQYCRKFVSDHLVDICLDHEVTLIWKVKMILMKCGILILIVRVKEKLRRYVSGEYV